MPAFWMITNRNETADGFGREESALSCWVTEETNEEQLAKKAAWEKVSWDHFKTKLIHAASQFPHIADPENHYEQKHIALFVHGYSNSWAEAVKSYRKIHSEIIEPADLGVTVLFTWPSNGRKTGYYPDRRDARRSADELSFVFSELYRHLLFMQERAMEDTDLECRAKVSVLAHSMGAFVVQKALAHAWVNQNQPLTASLINQLLLIAADVDSDLFSSGETVDGSDGDATANLCYRITCLYTGRDPVLGLSAGLKHFGKRRLGRSGLRRNCGREVCWPDNVWDYDISKLIPEGVKKVHSAAFSEPACRQLIQWVLRGYDRHWIAGR